MSPHKVRFIRYLILVASVAVGSVFYLKTPPPSAVTSPNHAVPGLPATSSIARTKRQVTVRNDAPAPNRNLIDAKVHDKTTTLQVPQPVVQFDAWAARYMATQNPAKRAKMESEGTTLAKARRGVMMELIARDPEKALTFSIKEAHRQQLPESVQEQVEHVVAGKGFYGLMTICHHQASEDGGTPTTEEMHPAWEHEIKREVVIDGIAYQASVYGTRVARLTEENASLYGVVLDGVMAVHQDDIVVASNDDGLVAKYNGQDNSFASTADLEKWLADVQAQEAAASELPTAASGEIFTPVNPPTGSVPPNTVPYKQYNGTYAHQKGPKTLLFVYVKPSDGITVTPAPFATMDANLNSTSQWFYNASYKQTWFGPKVVNADLANEFTVPRLTQASVNLPKTVAQYSADFYLLYSDTLAALRAQGGQWNGGTQDPNYFDRIIVHGNPKLIGSTGLAFPGGKFAWTGGGVSGGVAVHELVHNWGTIHSNEWTVPDGTPSRSASGSAGPGNPFHCMDGNGPGLDTTYDVQLGWLDQSAGEALQVPSSGTYRLFNNYDVLSKNPVSKLRALIIPLQNAWNLSLGFYVNGGTDGKTGTWDWSRNAVTLTTKINYSDSNVLDAIPGSRQQYDFYDAGVKIGQTYSEGPNVNGTQPQGGFHITPIARGNTVYDSVPHEWIDVVINYQNAISGNQPPTASFSQSIYQVAVNTPLALQVTANDPNNDALAYDWSFGDTGYNIVNLATQTHTWTAAGLYQLRATVSDMKGGVTTARAWVNVGNVPYQPPVTQATNAGLYYRYYEGSWVNLPTFANLLPVKTGTVATFSIAPRQVNDNFGFVYEGYITAPVQDIYTFNVLSDDGARLYIDNQLVIDNDGAKSSALEKSGNTALAAGNHAIRVEYFHQTGAETLEVSWSTLTMPKAPIAAGSLLQKDWGANAAPTVSVTAPVAGSQIIVGSNILLQTDAADADGIAKVQFFSGSALIGESTTTPFSVTWPKVSVGAKTVVAVAYDTTGRWTASAPLSFSVASPPPTNVIGVNLAYSTTGTWLSWSESVGAVYESRNWNNLRYTNSTPTLSNLVDQTGSPTTASVTASFDNSTITLGDATDGNGRMMKAGLKTISSATSRWASMDNIPFLQYDVYVYFDLLRSEAGDASAGEYRIGSQSKFGKNSLLSNDALGDYPNYDTWVGFKEATATTSTAPSSELLGNYVVFHNLTDASFKLDVVTTGRALNGIQVVEVPVTLPAVRILPPAGGWTVAEGGAPVNYTVRLTMAPTAPVTVTISPNAQLSADKTSLVFTPENWNQPQPVNLSAVDDAQVEGPHNGTLSHTVSATGGYTGVTAAPVNVTVADNDQPTVSVDAAGLLKEGVATTAAFTFSRSNAASLAAPLTVNFSITGTTLPDDYTLSGALVNFNAGTGTGSVVIPGGQAQVTLTVAAVDDASAEYTETLTATITAASAYVIASGSTATINVLDNDTVDYLAEAFNTTSYGSRAWDLDSKSLTFTPSGGGYTASIADVTAFPSGVTTFSTFSETAMSSGSASSGWWNYDLSAPFTFFGVAYTRIYVSTEGVLTFSAGTAANGAITNLFSTDPLKVPAGPRLAPFWGNLSPYTAGSVQYARVTTAGQQRTVIYYNGVRVFGSATNLDVKFQVELFDSGTIRITWLNSAALTAATTVGISSGVAADMPSSPFTPAATPRPFYLSDLSSYTSGTSTPPVFASEPPLFGTVGSLYSTLVAATDPDLNATLTLTAPTKPAWLTLTPDGNGTATLSGTPPASGTFPVVLQVSDGTATAQQSFKIIVAPSSGNTAPAFTSIPPTSTAIGSPFTYPITATDADAHSLAFSIPVRPSWLSLVDNGNGTATLSGTSPTGTLPSQGVTIAVTDGIASVNQSFILQVEKPPVITLDRPLFGRVEMGSAALDLHLESTIDGFGAASVAAQWTKLSGPGAAIFSNGSAEDSRVRFDSPGHYVLQLQAITAFGTTTETVQVFVETSASTILNNGLQIYYRFNEGTGTSAADASGNNRSATLNGGSTLSGVGYEGSSYSSPGGLTVYAITDYACPPQLTVSAWVNPDATPATALRHLFDFHNGTANRQRMYLPKDSRRFSFSSGFTTNGTWTINQDVPASEWTHVTLVYDGSSPANNPAVYFNGRSVPVTRVTAPAGTVQSSVNLRIGANASPTTTDTWQGRIDEFRVYNRLVPALDIPLLMSVGPINQAPRVDAGPSQSVSSTSVLTLAGAVIDDGLPATPGSVEVTWSQESGASGASIGATNSAQTTFQPALTASIYVLRLTADDGAARTSATTEIAVETGTGGGGGGGTGFATWIAGAEFGVPANQQGTLDDWEKDGIVNLIEFALGLNPSIANAAGLPVPSTITVGNETYLQLTYRQRKGGTGTVGVDYTADGVRFAVQTCETLASADWKTLDSGSQPLVEQIGTAVDNNDGTETVVMRLKAPISSSSQQFLRLRLTQTP